MATLLACLIVFFLYLLGERLALDRCRRRIPLRIAVTGTRGKSSLVRLLASILHEDGRRVVAKTTGSEAVVLLPDGSRIDVKRNGPPSILEQKRLIREGASLGADCLVCEMMSIYPENHWVESRHILKPNIVAITNVRLDHTEAMGETEEEIASVLSLAVGKGSTLFLPEGEHRQSISAEARRCGATTVLVKSGFSASLRAGAPELGHAGFFEDLDLAHAIAAGIGVSEPRILAGLRKAQYDVGALKVWRYRPEHTDRTFFLVNAFAANDPESTFLAMDRVARWFPKASGHILGLLNLRADRGARTVQWISFLRQGGLTRFAGLYLIGDHAGLARRRLPGAQVLRSSSPKAMMNVLCAGVGSHSLIFGFGNIKGRGRMLVDYWSRIGTEESEDPEANG